MRRPALATLALALLALFFGWETLQALRATPGGQDNAVPAGAWQPGVDVLDPQPASDPTPVVSAIAARPLFRQDRKPFQEGAAGAAAQNVEAQLSRYTLLGVLGFGDAPYGVVVGKGGNKGERWEVKKGDSFQEFTVKEVGEDGLRLMVDGREFLLPLYAGAPTATGGALRTETTGRAAAHATPAARAAAPGSRSGAAPGSVSGASSASAPGAAPPRPGAPHASPLASRLRRNPTVPMVPGISRSPLPYGAPPAVAPGSIPGSR